MASKINDYMLKQRGKEYIFSTSIVGNSIRLSCKNQQGKIYSKDFTVNDFKSLAPIFNEITSESDAIDYIDKALNIHKVGVHEEEEQIKITFHINIQGTVNQVEIPLGISVDDETLSSIPQTLAIKPSQNTIIENTPNIGPVIENLKTTFQPSKSNIITNAPKILPVKILEPKYINSGDKLNEISQVNQYNTQSFDLKQEQKENTNYFQTATNSINTINTTFYDNTPYMQNTSYNMDGQIFKNVQPTNDPNIFLSAPIQGKSYTSITHTLSEAQPIIRRPLEMDEGQNNIESILRGSLLKENEVNNIKIIGDPKVIRKEPIKEISGFDQEPITTTQFTTLIKTPSNIQTTMDSTDSIANIINGNDYNQYFWQQPQIQTDFSSGANNLTQNYIENYTQNYQAESLPLVQTDSGNNNYLQTQTTTKFLPSFEGDMNNLQNLGSQNFGEFNLTKTTYLTDDMAQNRLSLKSQNERIDKLEGDTNTLRNEQQQIKKHLNSLTGEMNNFRNSIHEVNNLRAQNELYKKQLSELNLLKPKVGVSNNLKSQESQMNLLKEQLNELDSIKSISSDNQILKKKIEELEKLKLEYEHEIRLLKEERRNTNFPNINRNLNKENNIRSSKISSGIESKQKTFEDKPKKIIVKGDIIQNTDELEMLIRKINKFNRKIIINLLYKASADSDNAANFHSKCDEAKSSIVLVETDKGKRFGGYTSCSWSGENIEKRDEDAFIFSLDKMKTYDNIPGEDAIGCYPKFGPIFLGCQIRIYDNAFSKGGTTFEKGLNYNTEEDYELTGGERTFNIKDIEVYEVIAE